MQPAIGIDPAPVARADPTTRQDGGGRGVGLKIDMVVDGIG